MNIEQLAFKNFGRFFALLKKFSVFNKVEAKKVLPIYLMSNDVFESCTVLLYNVNKEGCRMEAVSYSNFRQNLRTIMRKVNDDAQRLVVTTNDESDIVVMGKADYDSWQETLYLMQSKVNRQRLDESVVEAENSLQNLKELSLEDLIIDEDSDV